MLEGESELSSEMFPSQPPLFPSKECVNLDVLGVKEAKYLTQKVKKTLILSYYEAGLIIGSKEDKIRRIIKQTGAFISVGDLVKGSKGRFLELCGTKTCIDKALEMINAILVLDLNKMKENLTELTISDVEAGAIIGTKGTRINKIMKETGAIIIVGCLLMGSRVGW